jgi:predicted TIM-barrel fold metal-dependent hydrolase
VIIDVHGHISPPEALKRYPMPPSLGDVEGMIERKLEAGIELTIVGSPVGAGAMVPIAGVDNYAQPATRLAALHDWLAATCAQYSAHLRSYVYVNPFASDRELAAAAATVASDDAFVGLIVNTSVRGEYLDSDRAEPFFAMAAELAVPVLLHPPATPATGQGLRALPLLEHVGRFCDVTTGLACCIFGGWLDRYPGLQLIGAGGGGAIALLGEKLDLAHAAPHWQATGRPPLAAAPSSYLRRIWVDTASPSMLTLRANLHALGADRLLFGTDSPPLHLPAQDHIETVRRTAGERVLAANSQQLFGLKERVA